MNKVKFLFLASCFFVPLSGHAQDQVSDSLSGWKKSRKLSVLVNQSSFDNWLPGGVNNFSGTANYAFDFIHKGKDWDWTTKVIGALGYAKSQGKSRFQKTEDQLEVQSQWARTSTRVWEAAFSFNLKTQHLATYQEEDVQNPIERTLLSSFFSPAYLRLGAGFRHQKDERFQLEINPMMLRLILVDKTFTKSLEEGESYFGVDPDKAARWEAGGAINFSSKLLIAENILWTNRLILVSNYLQEAKNIDLDATTTLNLRVNDYLTTLLEVQFVYDDNALAQLQTRQVFGLSIQLPF